MAWSQWVFSNQPPLYSDDEKLARTVNEAEQVFEIRARYFAILSLQLYHDIVNRSVIGHASRGMELPAWCSVGM